MNNHSTPPESLRSLIAGAQHRARQHGESSVSSVHVLQELLAQSPEAFDEAWIAVGLGLRTRPVAASSPSTAPTQDITRLSLNQAVQSSIDLICECLTKEPITSAPSRFAEDLLRSPSPRLQRWIRKQGTPLSIVSVSPAPSNRSWIESLRTIWTLRGQAAQQSKEEPLNQAAGGYKRKLSRAMRLETELRTPDGRNKASLILPQLEDQHGLRPLERKILELLLIKELYDTPAPAYPKLSIRQIAITLDPSNYLRSLQSLRLAVQRLAEKDLVELGEHLLLPPLSEEVHISAHVLDSVLDALSSEPLSEDELAELGRQSTLTAPECMEARIGKR